MNCSFSQYIPHGFMALNVDLVKHFVLCVPSNICFHLCSISIHFIFNKYIYVMYTNNSFCVLFELYSFHLTYPMLRGEVAHSKGASPVIIRERETQNHKINIRCIAKHLKITRINNTCCSSSYLMLIQIFHWKSLSYWTTSLLKSSSLTIMIGVGCNSCGYHGW